ncbi:hypothetical protein [Liquorilactobacillus hordei]|uniref:hypothetical protein n=1 Tax=Liquorilactobacillus hordei TaxID=468911 RepID=UPI0039EAE0FD
MENKMEDSIKALIEDEFTLEILNHLKNNNIAININKNDILMNSAKDIITMHYVLECYKIHELENIISSISKCELCNIEDLVTNNFQYFRWCFGTQEFPDPFLQITANEIKKLTFQTSNKNISNLIYFELRNCYHFGVVSTNRMLCKFLSRLKAQKILKF